VPADPRDDFGVFEGREHLFHGLADPFALVRDEVEATLRRQLPGGVVESIVTYDEPKWLTIARRGEPGALVVASFGVCFRARIAMAIGYGREDVTATLTFLFGRWEDPEQQRMRTYFDLHADAAAGFDDDVLGLRLRAFHDEE
jgi:hypothetical protein